MTGPILMIGDSITDSDRRSTPDGLGDGWVRIVAEELRNRGEQRPVINRGIGGNRVTGLAERWQADALDFEPSLLTVYVGINDMWRRYDSDDPTDVGTFERVYRELLQDARDAGVPELVLMEPFLVPHRAEQHLWFEDLGPKQEAVARLARDFGATFVPLQSIFDEAGADRSPAELTGEGVHPTPLGSRLIADAWLATRA